MLRFVCYLCMLSSLLACGGGAGGASSTTPGGSSNSGNDTCLPAAVAETGTCLTDSEFFSSKAWPILNTCTSCHTSSGAAKSTAFILGNSSNSFDKVQSYFSSHGNTLLKKPSRSCNTPHGGGTVFSASSVDFQTLQQLSKRFTNPVSSCGSNGGSTGGGNTGGINSSELKSRLQHADGASLLRKASLHLSGELPDTASLNAAGTASEQNLRTAIRAALQGEGFKQFLLESANDQLLTLKFASERAPAYDQLEGWFYYATFNTELDNLRTAANTSTGATQEALQQQVNTLWSGINRGLAEEPLQLIAYVAENERPYTEILTANYIMVNPYTNNLLQAGQTFQNTDDENVWKAASHNYASYLNQNLPIAGILTSPMFLARYPSTDTNRNRARARWTAYFFLGIDIENLAVRPMNSDALRDADNPTLNNPDCAVCHTIMDPIAGTYQNWGNAGQYKDQKWDLWLEQFSALETAGSNSLPATYKLGSLFQPGDHWYRDMRAPGFNAVLMPSNRKDNSLQWLASQIVADDRFATGTVKFWFKALYGREPYALPTASGDGDYAIKLARYELDQSYIAEFAAAFKNGTAGTASHGAYNLKDLLVEMIMSPLYAMAPDSSLSTAEQQVLNGSGQGILLSPEQLARKLAHLTGKPWFHTWDAQREQWRTDFYGFYGGIDSDGVTERPAAMNTLMSTVAERYSNEVSCRLVLDEFSSTAANRRLFPLVETSDTPDSSAGRSAIRANISYLLNRLWAETSASEVDAAYNLFVALRDERINNGATDWLYGNDSNAADDSNDEWCVLDWDNPNAIKSDSQQVMRPWMGLLSYLLSDYRILYE